MKLLLDQNVSPKLVGALADLFPDSAHVQSLGLECSSDEEIWEYALSHGFAIVTKDEDYNDLSTLRGFPPKVIWLQLGNCKTFRIEEILRSYHSRIIEFGTDNEIGTFVLSRDR